MKLLCKAGRYEGEVIDYPPHVARALLKSGRAEQVADPERKVERAILPKVRR